MPVHPDNPSCAASIAYDVNYNKPYIASSPLNNRFVVYRMYWDDTSIRFTVVDNNVENRFVRPLPFPISAKEAAFQQPYFFILNMAVGGNFTRCRHTCTSNRTSSFQNVC